MIEVHRAASRLTVLVVSLSMMVGCSLSTGGNRGDAQAQIEATEGALRALEAELATRPGIEQVDAVYDETTGIPIPSQLRIVAVVSEDHAAEARATVEEVTRATWESDVPSIATVVVTVVNADGQRKADTRDVFSQVSVGRPELTERFGPRDR